MPRFSLFRRPSSDPVNPPVSGGLGTFGGVYTPSILTILGVIMYLRFGWVVGNVGLIGTLIIVTLATSITFFTGPLHLGDRHRSRGARGGSLLHDQPVPGN